ncbi:hypothetical protein HELRODRAFT_176457 [Helobdella robusta]|uniref:BHLH domain-containing protein n=1 Tax=Helobdella robusta TaxID=6412 RepID=T1FAJ0_HELRO|nr:hypothetical protein HELRODRAFT_176457 [Helobdella robusta]ESN99696.1 hypothetical protein HELRODRAFT_176457 [Helobdella robusta]
MSGFDDYEASENYVKLEQQSPTGNIGFSFSRASSVGSVNAISCSSASSTHNTDDEDSDVAMTQSNHFMERRREAHTQAEQKRRDAIKRGYEELQSVVPTCLEAPSQKLSKASILQKTIDYIQFLMQQKKKQEEDHENLKKEVTALKIMKSQYEQMVKSCQNSYQHGADQVTNEEKFFVFQQLMDALFQSFDASVSVNGFEELSNCVFTWLEDQCKPNTLKELTEGILRNSNYSNNINNNGFKFNNVNNNGVNNLN